MTIVAFYSLDTFQESNSINTLIGQNKQIHVSVHAVNLMYFGVVFFDFLNRFIGVDLFTVNGAILVGCNEHILIPNNCGVIDFSGVVKFEKELVRKCLENINVLIKRGGDNEMLLGNINCIRNC